MSKLYYLYLLYTHPKGALVRNSLAFSALMALSPCIALLSIASLAILRDTTKLQESLAAIIPPAMVRTLIQAGINATRMSYLPFLLTVGVSLFTASRGFYTSILAFKIFNNAKIKPLMISIQSVIAAVLFVLLVVIVILFYTVIHILLPDLPFLVHTALSLFFFHLIAATFFLVTSQPVKRYREIMVGSWTFAIGITLMGTFFFYYINHFTRYADLYGSMAGVLILILSMYWLSCLIYFCFCVNEWIRLWEKGVLNEEFVKHTTFFRDQQPSN